MTSSSSVTTLHRYPETLALVRLGPGADVPAWAESSSVFSVTATATETTAVCAGRNVPTKSQHRKPFTAYAAAGELQATTPGVLVALLAPLAEAEVSAHPVATFDSVWVLVARDDAERAEEAWRRSGLEIEAAVPTTPAGEKK